MLCIAFITTNSLTVLSSNADDLYLKMKDANDISSLEEILREMEHETADKAQLGRAYFLMGYKYEIKGSFTIAYQYYSKSSDYYRESKLFLKQKRAIENMAFISYKLGNYKISTQNHRVVLKINNDYGTAKQSAYSHRDIGLSLFKAEKYVLAIEEFKLAEDIFEEIGDNYGAGRINLALGNVFKKLKSYEKAANYYNHVQRVSTSKKLKAQALNNLAECEYQQGHLETAKSNIEESIKLKKELNDNRLLISGINNAAIYHYAEKSYSKAYEYFCKSFAINIDTFAINVRHDELTTSMTYIDSLSKIDPVLYSISALDAKYRNYNLSLGNGQNAMSQEVNRLNAENFDNFLKEEALRMELYKWGVGLALLLAVIGVILTLVKRYFKQRKIKENKAVLASVRDNINKLGINV